MFSMYGRNKDYFTLLTYLLYLFIYILQSRGKEPPMESNLWISIHNISYRHLWQTSALSLWGQFV